MSKKDYAAVAEVIKKAYDYAAMNRITAVETAYIIADDLATVFKIDNPNFDYEKFLLACGMNVR